MVATSTRPFDAAAPVLNAAFESFAGGGAASLTVIRGGVPVVQRASGTTNGGSPMTTASPMVVASVSKVITALAVARLVEAGVVSLDQPVPWSGLGVAAHPAWNDVTVGELMTHRSGMPIARKAWLDDPGSCAVPLQEVVAAPPTAARGGWVYSNGNYCALGLLVEYLTGLGLGEASRELVLEAGGAVTAHLVTDGALADDAPYAKGLVRLERLGGAGVWVISTDELAAVASTITTDDLDVISWPGLFVDQYGWGHTGTVDGAKSCLWVIDDGFTIVAATISGNQVATGGDLCDIVVPAAAADLGITGLGRPQRSPR